MNEGSSTRTYPEKIGAEEIEIEDISGPGRIDIQEFILPAVDGDPDTCLPGGTFASGHREPLDFLRAVYAYLAETWGLRCAEDTLEGITPDQVTHLYWREEPVEGEDSVLFVPCEKTDRKGYAVTRLSWYGEL